MRNIIKRSIVQQLPLLGILVFGAAFAQPGVNAVPDKAAKKCEEYLKKESYGNLLRNKPSPEKLLRYPQAVEAQKNPDWFLQFGFESEYLLSEIGPILNVYGPDPVQFQISSEAWFAKSSDERLAWATEHIAELFPQKREKGFLIRLKNDPQYAFLPDKLIRDTTGNVEIVLKPFDSLEEWFANVTFLNEIFGAGSMQGTVSSVSDSFFGRLPGQNVDEIVRQNMGYFNFMNEMDTINKLQAGATRYAVDQSKPVVRSFVHPFLGPMSLHKQRYLETFIRENARGRMYDAQLLKEISGLDSSFKYIGGTAYRPDIVGQDRIVLEVRDCHKTLDCLIERIFRNVHYLQKGREEFRNAEIFKAYDAVNDYNKFSPAVKKLLESLYPLKADPADLNAEELLSHQVYRNFSYPLKDWALQLFFLERNDLQNDVLSAQESYLKKLEETAAKLEQKQISESDAINQSQGALAQFSLESKLADAFETWLKGELHHDEAKARPHSPEKLLQDKLLFKGILLQSSQNLKADVTLITNERLHSLSEISKEGTVVKIDPRVPMEFVSQRQQKINVYDLLIAYHRVQKGMIAYLQCTPEEANQTASRMLQASVRVRGVSWDEFATFLKKVETDLQVGGAPVNPEPAKHWGFELNLRSE